MRLALRTWRTAPVFTITVVITIGLGIGGTTAIFALIDAVMRRPLPVSDPARLYRIGDGDDTIAEGRHGRWGFFSFPLYERLEAGAPEFEAITAFGLANPLSVRRTGGVDPASALRAEYVTGTYFTTLGVSAFSGRLFSPADDRPSATPVAVLSHRTWRDAYGADRSVIGSTLVVQAHPFIVIGVAAPGFFGESVRANPPDLWLPLQQEPLIAGAGSLLRLPTASWLAVIGRLGPTASIDGVGTRLTAVLRQWIAKDAGYPSDSITAIVRDLPEQTIDVVPAGAGIGFGGSSVKEQYGPSLRILFVLCSLVLAIACANVANLLLVRFVERRTQTAVRLALGATRRHIVVEALTESLMLAVLGAAAGLIIADGVARLLIALAFGQTSFVPITATPSLTVVAFAAALSLMAGAAFGAGPAWIATRTDPTEALRGSWSATGHRTASARTGLLIAQATLSVVLVACSTLLARSIANLEQQNFGYSARGRVVVGLNRLPSTYTSQQLTILYRQMEQRLRALPGVRGAGLAAYNPLAGIARNTIVIAGHATDMGRDSLALSDRVGVDYLSQLGVTLVRGRFFTLADDDAAPPVAVVNEAFAKRFFGADEDPIDRHFGIESANAGTFRIVGITHDAKFRPSGLHQPPEPMFFVPLAQHVTFTSDRARTLETFSHLVQGIVLVTDTPPGRLTPVLKAALAELDPNLTVASVRTLQDHIDILFDRERAVATLAGLFAAVALTLAVLGVNAVTAYTVAQRTKEMGIRMALGADRACVIRLVLATGFRYAVFGIAIGVPAALAAGRALATQLYGVSFWDPVALVAAAGSLVGCTLLAALIPARGATAISPMDALRTH